ncbi:MAG: DUF2971 domain-containing protein [Hyphomicrobium sp.]
MSKITVEDVKNVQRLFEPLFDDVGGDWKIEKPIIAHYTSVSVAERILATETIWFSNPRYMNDHEELRWGLIAASNLIKSDPGDQLRESVRSETQKEVLQASFDHYLKNFEQEHLTTVFASCWTQHEPDETNGILSMWRGYGGSGRGVAIEININAIKGLDESPLLFLKVSYGNENYRRAQIQKIFENWCRVLSARPIADNLLHVASHEFFQISLLFALCTKHNGFSEEHEWRIVYLPDRDTNKALDQFIGYGEVRGRIEPKLKLRVGPIPNVMGDDVSLDSMLHGIILGPGQNDPLSIAGFRFMLDRLGKRQLRDLVKVSGIPFRA